MQIKAIQVGVHCGICHILTFHRRVLQPSIVVPSNISALKVQPTVAFPGSAQCSSPCATVTPHLTES
eukprot:1275572-Amphidinium_carterae.1